MKPNEKYPHLLSPLTVGKITFKHRMMSSPTSQAEVGQDGGLTADNINYYRMRALGGASLVTIGDCVVDLDTGKGHPLQVGINEPAARYSLARCADAIHSGGALAAVQIDHGGELCSPEFMRDGKTPMGPTEFVDEYGDFIRAMTRDDIEYMADRYADAAQVAKECGYDMVQVHCGHGWLLHQFISELSNKRTDEFGGSFENRMRFPLMVLNRIRDRVGRNFPIEARISASELLPNGYGIETGIEIAKAIDGIVDLIHVSAGTQKVPYSAVLMHPPIFSPEAPFADFAKAIKQVVKTPVSLVGAVHNPDLMEKLIAEGYCDTVAMGRALVADPYLPSKVVKGREDLITPCLRCLDCEGSLMETRNLKCAVNPFAGREEMKINERPAAQSRRVLIAGGGPAGAQCAITAAERGHKVILVEKKDHLGGALEFADSVDFKVQLKKLRISQEIKMRDLGVDLRLGTACTPELVREIDPDVFVVAIGAEPLRLPIPGLNDENVTFGADYAGMQKLEGQKIVICGGGLIGCETALHLAKDGKDCTIIEMLPQVAGDCNFMHRMALMPELESRVTIKTSHRCTKIEKNAVYAVDENGVEQKFDCDAVVVAMGLSPRTAEVNELRGIVAETVVIGDCAKSGRIMHATRAGWETAMNI
jgi:2,4-dienoyl-CoA reductase-like NADH-dependent reductase (Old Yellow Enzyme family)/thioredoxin reductase